MPSRPRCGWHERAGVRGRVRNASPGRLGEAGGGVQSEPHGLAEGGQRGCRDGRRAVLARGVQRGVELPSGPSEGRRGVQGARRASALPRVSRGVSSPLWSRGRRGVRGSAPANDASGTDAPLGRRSATCLVSTFLALSRVSPLKSVPAFLDQTTHLLFAPQETWQ